MRNKAWIGALLIALGAIGWLLVATQDDVRAATEDEIEAAIVAGLDWLASQQNPDGSWGPGWGDEVAYTGLVVLKMETRAIEMGMDPMDPAYTYAPNVVAGLDYIMSNAHTVAIGMEPGGDPDSNGNGIGVYFNANPWGHEIYNSSLGMMAVAACGHPEMHLDMLQDCCDFMVWAQADPDCDLHRGGWRYGADQCDSDNSNSGYVTLALGFAQAPPPYGFGIPAPEWCRNELSLWIDVIQDDVDGDPDDGGSWYDPYTPWVNILKTGNLLYEMALVGDTLDTPRVQDALDYIERHWADAGGGDTGWRDHRQAMFTMMKGFEAFGIELIDLDDDGIPEHDWFAEVSDHLVATQDPAGFWPMDPWGDEILSTAWAMITLERAVPALQLQVPIDIKPTSCPNPLNPKSKGLLPVAILGTEDFDVTTIDPMTILLGLEGVDEAVPVLRWAYEDVATPFEGELCDCHEEGPDGQLDLTLKFSTPELVNVLGLDTMTGNTLPLLLRGNLFEEFGGGEFLGEDCIRIK